MGLAIPISTNWGQGSEVYTKESKLDLKVRRIFTV